MTEISMEFSKLQQEGNDQESFWAKLESGDPDFEDFGLLGCGQYGNLNLWKEASTGKAFVVKTVEKSKLVDEEEEEILRRLRENTSLTHKNLVKCHHCFFDAEKGNLKIVMDYCQDSSFSHLLKNTAPGVISDEDVFMYFFQVLVAIEALHSKGITFGNFKLDNIVIQGYQLLGLTDYFWDGVISQEEFKMNREWRGGDFNSPEMLRNWNYGPEADLWALGVFLYRLLESKMPFGDVDSSSSSLVEKIKMFSESTLNISFSSDHDTDLQDLALKLIRVNPGSRLSFDEIYEHPAMFKYVIKFGISIERVKKEIYGDDYKPKRFNLEDADTQEDSEGSLPGNLRERGSPCKVNPAQKSATEKQKSTKNNSSFSLFSLSLWIIGASAITVGTGFAYRYLIKH